MNYRRSKAAFQKSGSAKAAQGVAKYAKDKDAGFITRTIRLFGSRKDGSLADAALASLYEARAGLTKNQLDYSKASLLYVSAAVGSATDRERAALYSCSISCAAQAKNKVLASGIMRILRHDATLSSLSADGAAPLYKASFSLNKAGFEVMAAELFNLLAPSLGCPGWPEIYSQ
jgi:hypothetical protein